VIRAIETHWKGYRFRSRLEARWAVFFEAMGLRWDYEPEGFDLGEKGCYLPDFFLPQVHGGVYVEIKHAEYLPEAAERSRWGRMVNGTQRLLLVCNGVPECKPFRALRPGKPETGSERPTWVSRSLVRVPDVCAWPRRPGPMPLYLLGECGPTTDAWAAHYMAPAVRASRAARFEHGEQPR